MDLSPGTSFAGYRLQAVAGRGGMGVVYRATELELERTVALKLIAPELAEDPDFRARFVRESRVAASIDHPNVIPIYAAGEHDGSLYIAMRYVEGEDMRALLRREGALEPGRAAQLVSQIAAALDAAHARGIVHRDVKPANILLGAGDHVYLTDFGLTKNVGSTSGLSHAGQWVGTLGYVAPEQIRGGHVDARADVYALGCLLFFALTGETPYRRDSDEATMWAHLNEPPPSPSRLVAGVAGAFDDVIARALAKDPADRFPSTGDLGRAALAAAGRITATPPERRVAVGEAAPTDDTPTATSPGAGATERGAPGTSAVTVHAATATEPATPPPRRRRGRSALILGLTLLLPAVALAVVLFVTGGGDDDTPAAPVEASDAGEVHVGVRPNDVVVAAGYAWAVSNTEGTITRVQTKPPYEASPDLLDVGSGATALAAGDGSMWVVKQSTNGLLRYDLNTRRRQADPIQLPPGVPFAVAAGEGGIWVGSRSGRGSFVPQSVSRIDPKTNKVVATKDLPDGMQDLAVGAGSVWIASRRSNSVTRLDPKTMTTRRIVVPGRPTAIAVGAGAVWVTIADRNLLVRVGLGSTRDVTSYTVGTQPKGVAAAADAVWVSNESDSTVVRFDPRTRKRVGDPVDVGINPKALAIDGQTVWVADVGQDALSRVVF
ncbi:MAG TPA: protein kinase [Solirubrobacteraceae bacterium]|nr:protein kinase [Solirubrobacteraceae bacterium]